MGYCEQQCFIGAPWLEATSTVCTEAERRCLPQNDALVRSFPPLQFPRIGLCNGDGQGGEGIGLIQTSPGRIVLISFVGPDLPPASIPEEAGIVSSFPLQQLTPSLVTRTSRSTFRPLTRFSTARLELAVAPAPHGDTS
jgi:hypothetical protein